MSGQQNSLLPFVPMILSLLRLFESTNFQFKGNLNSLRKYRPKCSLSLQKKIFHTQKCSLALDFSFLASQERPSRRVWTFRDRHFDRRARLSGWWCKMVARPGCPDMFWSSFWKQTSYHDFKTMSIEPYQLEPEYSSSEQGEEEQIDSGGGGRSLFFWLFDTWKSPDGPVSVWMLLDWILLSNETQCCILLQIHLEHWKSRNHLTSSPQIALRANQNGDRGEFELVLKASLGKPKGII